MPADGLRITKQKITSLPTYISSFQFNGQQLPPVAVSGFVVLSKTAVLKSKTTIYNVTFDTIVRQLDSVVVSAPNGTIIATCHP